MEKRSVTVKAMQAPVPGRNDVPQGCMLVYVRLSEGDLDHGMEMVCKGDDPAGAAMAVGKAMQRIIDEHDAILAAREKEEERRRFYREAFDL